MVGKSKKVVTFDVQALKDKVAEAGKATLNQAKAGRNRAIATILGQGIKLTQKQLETLENVQKGFT